MLVDLGENGVGNANNRSKEGERQEQTKKQVRKEREEKSHDRKGKESQYFQQKNTRTVFDVEWL